MIDRRGVSKRQNEIKSDAFYFSNAIDWAAILAVLSVVDASDRVAVVLVFLTSLNHAEVGLGILAAIELQALVMFITHRSILGCATCSGIKKHSARM